MQWCLNAIIITFLIKYFHKGTTPLSWIVSWRTKIQIKWKNKLFYFNRDRYPLKHEERKVLIKLTNSLTIFMISSRALYAFFSYPVIVIICSSGSPLRGKLIWTSWSLRILLITAPFRPIIFGWYSGSTSSWLNYLYIYKLFIYFIYTLTK